MGNVLGTPNDDNESIVVSKLIVAANELNPIGYNPDAIFKLVRNLKPNDVQEFNKKLQLKEDLASRVKELEERLEESSDSSELIQGKLKLEIDELKAQLQRTNEDNRNRKKDNTCFAEEFDIANRCANDIMDILDQKSIIRSDEIPNNIGDKFNSLLNHVSTIVSFRDDLEKEVQAKNLKIMELEKALLQREINKETAPSENASEMRESKIPGKIRNLERNSQFGSSTKQLP